MDSTQERIIAMSYNLKHFSRHMPLNKYDSGAALHAVF